jgi:hypothetical protein
MRALIVALVLLAGCKAQSSVPPAGSSSVPASSTSIAAPVDAAVDAHFGSAPFFSWNFDGDTVGSTPPGFTSGRTGSGREGKWIVRAEADAPSGPNVLAQTDDDPTDNRFPMLWVDSPVLDDVAVWVKCKPVSGKVDRACGLVCRLKDANNYYLTRANALENNVRFYVVENGTRKQLASWSGKVTSDQWHSLQMICHKQLFTISFDKEQVIRHVDKTSLAPGKVGLWTKADSVTYFDDFGARPVFQL